MIPVYQTIDGPDGNCYQACMASILEVPLGEIPTFAGWRDLRAWLAERGWSLVFGRKDGCSIASQQTIRGIHAVVCFDGEMVHDPSPRPFGRPDYPVVLWTKIERLM
jgi:hypothetical protein